MLGLDAGVVHEHPQAVGEPYRVVERDVELFHPQRALGRGGHGLVGQRRPVSRVTHRRHDVEALVGELERHRAADPAARAGHHCRALGVHPASLRSRVMDPKGHTLEVRDDTRHVQIAVDGVVVASSTAAVVLEETGLPARYYLPRADVRTELLRATDKATSCPFKGGASYWSLELDGAAHPDIVWSYEDPIEGMEAIAGRLAFFDERVDVTIDGVPQERPRTQWTPGVVPAEHP